MSPQVTALNINSSPVIIASIAATSEDGLDEAARVAQEEIKPALLAIDGVGSVDITGGEEQRVLVTLDPDKLAANGISIGQVTGVLAANNLTFPSGEITTDTSDISVSTIGRIESVDAVRNLVVGVATPQAPAGAPTGPTTPAASGGAPASGEPTASGAPAASAGTTGPVAPTPVTIGDLGTVEIQGVATTGYARTDGQPALSLSVSKTSDANTVLVADAVTAELEDAAAQHADTVSVTVVSDFSGFIKESRDGLLKEGGLGAMFAVLTIFLFLFSIRSTIVAAVSIPLSILTALVIMQITGTTLNIMTLGGLAVAVGRVVDDAIVVLENIYRHRALGEDRLTASINGPKEVAGAITAATITTVGVFLPLGFVGGLVSQLFLPFALTVTFALLASLVVALTVVPVLAYLLINKVPVNVDEDGEPKNSLWIRAYTPAITMALRSRATKLGVVGVAIVLFVATAALAPLLPTAFIDAGGENLAQATIAPPAGASTEAVLAHAMQAEEILAQDPNVLLVQTSIPGEGEAGFQVITAALSGRPANSARMAIRLVDTVDVTEYSKVLADALAPVKTDGFDVAIAQLAGFSANNLNVVVSGESATDVAAASDIVLDALSDNPDLLNLKSDLSAGTPEIQVTPDPNKAIMVGLTAAQVAQEVRAALVGSVATRVVIDADGATADIFVELDPAAVASVEDLQALLVGTVAKMPLGEIATVEQVSAQGSITRIDQSPAASISAEIVSQDTGSVSADVQAEIDALVAAGQVPQGVEVSLAGVTAQMEEAFGGLYFSMLVADPRRLRGDGPDVQLAHHAVHHPVQPAARHDRRPPGAAPHRQAAGRQRPDRVPDAHRHRGHQRDRAARPRRTAAVAGSIHPRRAHRGRPDPGAADPDDRDRDDPRACPARGGLQPGIDHRGGARHGRHRRPVLVHVPDPARDPGDLLAGRRTARSLRSPDGRTRERERGLGLITQQAFRWSCRRLPSRVAAQALGPATEVKPPLGLG